MVENSSIEWTHHTFNPVTGCQKVGPGCDNCYAEGWAKRSGLVKWGPGEERRPTSDAYWRQPLKWDRVAAAAGERRRVFCASLADVFDNAWPAGIRERLFDLIKATPHLDWMLLTKRPGNIARMLPPDWGRGYTNVWLGCTVTSQDEADRDVPKLLAIPARVRFLSMEPLLGPVDLTALPYGETIGNAPTYQDALRGKLWMPAGTPTWAIDRRATVGDRTYVDLTCRVDLVIVGGESGPGARPMHPDHVLSLRDQCVSAGVSFFFKQWGEYEADQIEAEDHRSLRHPPDHVIFRKVGKKAAGRKLHGRTWDQMPGALT